MSMDQQDRIKEHIKGSADEEPLLTTYTEEDLKELNRKHEQLKKHGSVDAPAPHFESRYR